MWSYDIAEINSFSNSTLNFPNIYYDLTDKDWGYYLRNKFQELDAGSEWWWDQSNSQLYLWPPGNVDPNSATVETSVLENGFQVEWGRSWVEIRDLQFQHQKVAGIRIDVPRTLQSQIANSRSYIWGSVVTEMTIRT